MDVDRRNLGPAEDIPRTSYGCISVNTGSPERPVEVIVLYGLLKSRFRILSNIGRVLLYSPEKCCRIIMAAAVLHNLCLRHNVREPETMYFHI